MERADDEELLSAEFDNNDDNDVPDYAKAAAYPVLPSSASNSQSSGSTAPKYPSITAKPVQEPVKRSAQQQETVLQSQDKSTKAADRVTSTMHHSNQSKTTTAGTSGGKPSQGSAQLKSTSRPSSHNKPIPSSQTQDTQKQVKTGSRATATKWKDVLVRAGLGLEYAWKYGLALSEAGFDESNAQGLEEGDLIRLGLEKQSDRLSVLRTIQEIASEMSMQHSAEVEQKAGIWEALLKRAKLGPEWTVEAIQYAHMLAESGWNESNVEDLTEDHLEALVVSNAAHREVILQLVDREIAEARAHPNAYQLPSNSSDEDDDRSELAESTPHQVSSSLSTTKTHAKGFVPSLLDPSKPFSKKDVKEVERVRRQVEEQLEAFDEFERRLGLILRGDTQLQREQRARREAEMERRKVEREQRRVERLIARTVKRAGGGESST